MPDLLWDDVKNFFDPELMGALPDVAVPGTTVEDWQTVLDLVRDRGWKWEYREDGVAVPLASAADMVSAVDREVTADLRVWPVRGVEVIFRLYVVGEVSFEVDLRELQGQAGVDLLMQISDHDRSYVGEACADDPRGGRGPSSAGV
ncbi:hypothetical protein [Actinophytocola sp. NPDC049390]|uniref:hypothetical protein n=1 Tax=Actinophytocola sp. NPDC049390 TaxID=3363894 RepID=UPI0037B13BF3